MIYIPRVLVLEDDTGWVRNFQKYLASSDWLVQCVTTVDDGLTALTCKDYFALVLDVDIRGKPRGVEFVKGWCKSRPSDRVVVVSAILTGEIRDQLADLGIVRVFDKIDFVDRHSDLMVLLQHWYNAFCKETELEQKRNVLRTILRGFDQARISLASRQRGKGPFLCEDEYDVQDLLTTLICPIFPEITREEPTRRVGPNAARIDLFFPEFATAIEVKVVRSKRDLARISSELKDDIETYGLEGRCDFLICFVFDLTRCLSESDMKQLVNLAGNRAFDGPEMHVEVMVS